MHNRSRDSRSCLLPKPLLALLVQPARQREPLARQCGKHLVRYWPRWTLLYSGLDGSGGPRRRLGTDLSFFSKQARHRCGLAVWRVLALSQANFKKKSCVKRTLFSETKNSSASWHSRSWRRAVLPSLPGGRPFSFFSGPRPSLPSS